MDRRAQLKLQYQNMKIPSGIIQIKNNVNGKVFITSGINLEGIMNRHRFQLKAGSHQNKELQREWNEFGADNFTIEILETIENPDENDMFFKDTLDKRTEEWLAKIQPYEEKGYHKRK